MKYIIIIILLMSRLHLSSQSLIQKSPDFNQTIYDVIDHHNKIQNKKYALMAGAVLLSSFAIFYQQSDREFKGLTGAVYQNQLRRKKRNLSVISATSASLAVVSISIKFN